MKQSLYGLTNLVSRRSQKMRFVHFRCLRFWSQICSLTCCLFFCFFPAAEGIQEGISVDGISRDINASQIGGTVLKSSDAGTVITQNQENNRLCGRKDTKINYGEKKKPRNETKQKTKSLQCFLGGYVQEAEMVFW